MSRRLAVLHSLTIWCPCSNSRHWQELPPLLWTKWHRLPLSLHTGGIICFHIFLSSLISDLITIPNWEDLLDDDVNRKPIWWQGFWKMMQNSGFQTLKMSWNVLNCPFRSWINHFLPQILQPGFSLEPGRVTQSHLDLSQIRYFLQTRLCLGFFQGGRSAGWKACPPRRAQLLQGLGSLQVWHVCNVY